MGAGLSFTFVPLATITVDPIPSEEMGYATSIISLMRNVGASIGISIVATILARRRQTYQTRLVANLTPTNTTMQNMLATMRADFIRHGANAVLAGREALALLYRLTLDQAAALSYMDAFRLLGVMFVIVSPFVWLMHRSDHDSASHR